MSLIVIKYGGSLLDNPDLQRRFLEQVATEWKVKRHRLVLVHGGGKEINRQMEKAGLEPKFINGRRFTDAKTMEVVERALRQLNESIVLQLRSLGVDARGYSGRYEHLAESSSVAELGRVGKDLNINKSVLKKILTEVSMPVFYSVAEDAKSEPLNVNADDFAMVAAIGLGADELTFLTDTGGVLDKSGQLISQINRQGAEALMKDETITGGMAVKIQACFKAITDGVGKITIGESVVSDAQGFRATHGTVISKEGPTVMTIQ